MEKNENGYPITNNGAKAKPIPDSGSMMIEARQLAMVYSPKNEWRMIYTPSDALRHGTLFEELYKPLDY